jgi:hypothetical protein
MAINGNYYDWESIEIQLPSGIAIGITEISYSDEKGVEARYGKGSVPRGYGRKNYSASGSMVLDKDEAERLRAVLGGSVYKAVPFPIIVSYSNADQPVIVDTLPDVKITKADTSAKQDDDNAGAQTFDFVILSPIKWGGRAAY